MKLSKEIEDILNKLPSGLCVYRMENGRIYPVFHNPAFHKLLGYSKENLERVNREMTFLGVHQEDMPALREKVDQLIGEGKPLSHICRVFNDTRGEYRWICIEGSLNEMNGVKLLYAVYSDVSEQKQLEQQMADANEKMQDIINAIPGGVAIYKVSDIFETVYFSEGVPELSGYSVEEYRELTKQDAAQMTYWEDTARVKAKAMEVIRTHETAEIEFRKQHRDGHIVWVRAHIKWIGEENGCPLLHCVFHNISSLKETQLEMNHLVNSIPGGIASYQLEQGRIKALFVSEGVIALSGYDREEYEELIRDDAMNLVYEADRGRIIAVAEKVAQTGIAMDVSCRICHKDGRLFWVHMNGQRMGPGQESTKLTVVLTGMSPEARLFQSIANETADGIYVIDKENYDLLYVNESRNLFSGGEECVGRKCYAALHGYSEPCPFCTLKTHRPDGEEHAMRVGDGDRFYTTRFREMDWNGIPAYVKYVRDTTRDEKTRREKERLEQYFQTLVKNLPGGVAVIRYNDQGSLTPEYLSDGLAAMTSMTIEEAWTLYRYDIMEGLCPDDREMAAKQFNACITGAQRQCEIVCRLKNGTGGYIWVKGALSLIQTDGSENRVYVVYHDITREREEQDRVRQQYQELLLQHYRTPGPDTLILAHCNITKRKILDVIDYTGSDLLTAFGNERDRFFTGLSGFVVDPEERRAFLGAYLSEPALKTFAQGKKEQLFEGFVKLPREELGRYVQVKMNMVVTPDSGDITGILTVTDVTERTISDRILRKVFKTGYDFIVDLDLTKDSFALLSQNENMHGAPPPQGCHSEWTKHMLASVVLPKDRERYKEGMEAQEMLKRLKEEDSYTFAFSLIDENGEIRTKNMTVSAIDLRLGRVSMVRTDITNSVREQQGLLNVIAYTFERLWVIDINSGRLTMYTRRSVLENLPPEVMEDYRTSMRQIVDGCDQDEAWKEAEQRLSLDVLLNRLRENPAGFDFVLSYQSEEGRRYKQINVLWGDENRQTICLVRADVTEILTSERASKRALEEALVQAQKANAAKQDFLSTMSHDIRTPMNAIMGMTEIAAAHLADRSRVEDCLEKISVSSRHLLSLVNDILDMSKIEQSQIALNRMRISISDLKEQLSVMMGPQARSAGLHFETQTEKLEHNYFYGDNLRINQILINLLSNAIKFTPEGGRVDFLIEELAPASGKEKVRYRFTVSDTGIGMSEDFLEHIFEPFIRGREASRVSGTGLGLSITKALVDLMGGVISVESRKNAGSIFRVELEFDLASAVDERDIKAGPAVSDEAKPFTGRCFLVAEDNAINAEILCELLQLNGAESVVKTDGAQAVRAFRDAPPGTYDAILMDIQMPEMNGYEATRAIRKLDRQDAAQIPIIAMTANAFAEDVQAALEAGMNAHVAKPLNLEILRTTLLRELNLIKEI